jgi:RNA polymerase sigma-70 factor, ECF subfamily
VSDPRDLLDPDLLVARYGERVYRVARSLVGNDADAEDVTQATLTKVLEKASTFRGESDPMGWIYRIAMNEARELLRRRKRRPTVSLDRLPVEFDESSHPIGIRDFSGRPEREAMAEEVRARVNEAIEELPDGYREAVVLHDIEGMPYAESAELMEIGLAAFKTRLHRARLHLRRRLQEFWDSVDEGSDASRGGRA